jgi:hypothetical protein
VVLGGDLLRQQSIQENRDIRDDLLTLQGPGPLAGGDKPQPTGPTADGELSSEALGKWLTVAQRIIPKLLEDLRFVRPQMLVKQGMCVC